MLHEIQRDFRRAVLDNDGSDAATRIVSDKIRAAERLTIYRGNTMVALGDVLAQAFPVTRLVASEDNFKVLAGRFIRAHPPVRPYLYSYGDEFPGFIAGFEAAVRDHPFLPDLARLEWAGNEVYFAADAAVLAPETIQAIPQEHYPSLRFTLHPACRIVDCAYRVLEYVSGERDPEVYRHDCPEGPQHVLITRPEVEVRHETISAGDAAMLQRFRRGKTLEDAAVAAAEAEPEFQLMQALIGHLARGTFTSAA